MPNDDEIIEKKKLNIDNSEIGWDLINIDIKNSFELGNLKIINDNSFAIMTDLPKLSDSERGLYLKVFNYIKNLPIQDCYSDVRAYFRQYCESNNILINKTQAEYLLKIIVNEINSFGPLTYLLNDHDNIEEIAVIGLGKENPVYIYVAKIGWLKTNLYFTDEIYVKELINRMSRVVGRRITLNNPLMNASLSDGSRLSAIIPPISCNFPILTLRRFKYNPLTPLDLISFETMSEEMAVFFWLALQTDSNILICGNTGSGKTTTLNALFSFVPDSERIIIAEETPEVNIPHSHKVKLKIDDNLNINMNDLITATLRMRPDRLIVGEIRSADEVHSFMNTILAGQGKGSIATFHALSSGDAIQRLIKLGMHEPDINALDLIVVQRRWNIYNLKNKTKTEVRKIVSISEINDAKLSEIYSYDYKNKKWLEKSSNRMKNKIEITFNENYDVLKNKFSKSLQGLIKQNKQKQLSLNEFFERVTL